MHKKLASDLTSLAHSILKMKNKDEVFALKEKAYEVYEKLSVLAYVEEYINNTPNPTKTKEELLTEIAEAELKRETELEVSKETVLNVVGGKKEETTIIKDEVTEVKPVIAETVIENTVEKEGVEEIEKPISLKEKLAVEKVEEKEEIPVITEEKETLTMVEEITEQPFDELEGMLFGKEESNVKDDVKDIGEKKVATLEDELQDTLPVDVMANLFEKAVPKKTLNDHLQNTIQIGLNDRIAFVKHLFEGNQTDYNRVISQLNTVKTEKEAKQFITKMIKPEYDWSTKEEYELRFMEIIERRFS